MNYEKTFVTYLEKFESVLGRYGFARSEQKHEKSQNDKEWLSTAYTNTESSLKIYIDHTIFKDDSFYFGFTMYKIPNNKTFFSLIDFLDGHDLNYKITYRLSAGGDFEPFVAKYFEDLEKLFANELNDQITGKTFENHKAALLESWNRHMLNFGKGTSPIYEMQKQEVADFLKKKKETETKKN